MYIYEMHEGRFRASRLKRLKCLFIDYRNLILLQSVISCQSLCQSHADCSHFTHYGPTGAIPNTCYLFTECPARNEHCHDCHTGPKHCKPDYKDCRPIGADYGGTWFCFPELYSTNAPVKHGARCVS